MRWSNYDTVDAAVRFVNTEAPGNFNDTWRFSLAVSQSCSGSQTLPASFCMSANPSWLPSGKALPAAGPDVTTGKVANTEGTC
jgi:hypothetical protein